MANVLIFVPSYGHQVSAATFQATHKMVPVLHAKGHGVAISTYSSPDISEIRNVALTHWFDGMEGSSHLLMIDADMGFPPELVVDMLALNEPMVGAIYPKKLLEVEWAASGWGKDANAGGKGHFMKVRGLGMGCFLIRRDAIAVMIEKLPDVIDTSFDDPGLHPKGRLLRVFDPMRNAANHRMSEDISFCYRWELCGGEVWGAGGYEMEHVGMHSFKACYAKWADEKTKADHKGDGPMNVSAPYPKDSAIMRAWESYKSSEDYKNNRYWATRYIHDDDLQELELVKENGSNPWTKEMKIQAVEGSLWAAFMHGWLKAGGADLF